MKIEVETQQDARDTAEALLAFLNGARERLGCAGRPCECVFCRCARDQERVVKVIRENFR